MRHQAGNRTKAGNIETGTVVKRAYGNLLRRNAKYGQ